MAAARVTGDLILIIVRILDVSSYFGSSCSWARTLSPRLPPAYNHERWVTLACIRSQRCQLSHHNLCSDGEVTAFAGTANSGLIMTAGGASPVHRKLIMSLAARYKLPATDDSMSPMAG
jgi:hypothetical protein